MKFSFKDTQKRVEEIIALKGDEAPHVITELLEAAYLEVDAEHFRQIKDFYTKGYSGPRIAGLLALPTSKVYKIINYIRE